ncbi:DUF4349 domain-containing protein [Treponema sp.]|uniref:DUF4349 domain-containing protein n=1 Tax=Treponema sp. TaxID=166 RepID=UPI00298D76B2|nr:DUF4349 domain-containing protein [Treponema sp.]MCQ2241660.1 DUF4349 domain-containing protein [Treponema sp.]
MKARKITIMALTGLILFGLAGCGNKKYADNGVLTKQVEAPRMAKMKTANTVNSSFVMADAMEMESYVEESAAYGNNNINVERKLIKTGNITLESDTLSNSENLITEFAKSFGGYITDSSTYEYSYHATVKIPSSKFEEAMTAAGELGKIKYRSVNSQDVTEDFYDLKTRLDTKKIMRDKLESYLSQAKDIKDLLEIERQLNNVISEIEVMEGRLKRLSNQVDYSTIYIGIELPTGFNDSGFEWPDLGENFRKFGSDFVNFMASLLMGIFYFIVFGVPLLAVLAFFFWLLFGRVGLIVKLIKILKKKKE